MDKKQIKKLGERMTKFPCKKCKSVGYIQDGKYREYCWDCAGKGWVKPKPDDPSMQVVVRTHGKGLPLPSYQTFGSSGMDLYAAVVEDVVLKPMERKLIPTGLMVAIPIGYEGQIRPRSGLALKHGIGMPNSIGTIDSDYRGELRVLLINLGESAFSISRGMRIAQLVICPIKQVTLSIVDRLSVTHRGSGGFGSTGGL